MLEKHHVYDFLKSLQSLGSVSVLKGGLWEEGPQNTLIALIWELGIDCVFQEQFVCGK